MRLLCLSFSLYFFFSNNILFPQATSKQTSGLQGNSKSGISLTGTVRDSANNSIQGATVSLINHNKQTLIKATFSDKDGGFEFENINEKDTVFITITCVGFAKYTSTLIATEPSTNRSLGVITLEIKSSEATEISVTAKRNFVERKIDKAVITPEALISNDGTNTLEVLAKSPGIVVDANENISMKGKSGVNVLIDDRPTNLSGEQLSTLLRSLPSGSVSTIELITNPGAKYDAEGNAGIINIKLKKKSSRGFNGGVNLAYGQGRYMRTNNSVNFNYKIDDLNFFSNASFSRNKNYQDLTIWRNYFTPNTSFISSTFTQNSYSPKDRSSINLRIGLDYYATSNSTIGLSLSGFINPSEINATNNAKIGNSKGEITGLVEVDNPVKSALKNGSANLNYNLKLDTTGQEITANFDYIAYGSSTEQSLISNFFNADKKLLNTNILQSDLPATLDIKAINIDYSLPTKELGLFETGIKTSFVATMNSAEFYDVVAANKTLNYEFSNKFNYNENINSAYINYSNDFGAFSLQAGLRLENTNIKGLQYGNIKKQDSAFERNYNNLFPTFYLAYKADTAGVHQFNFSFGRRIERPDYQDLNPFTYPMDRFTYYGGNPFLKPTYSYNYSLSHTYNNFLTTTFDLAKLTDVINETNEQRDTIYYSRPGNYSEHTTYAVSLEGGLEISDWWTLQFYTELRNNVYKSLIYNQNLDEHNLYWYFGPTNQFKFGNGFSGELAGNFQGNVLVAQFLIKPIHSLRAGVAKNFTNGFSLKLNLSDMFYTNQVDGDIRNIANAKANWFSYTDSRVLTLSLSYRFSQGENLRQRKTGGSESEQKRVK